ncbi:glycine hydroxymethyltransferase shm1, partial [Coemansia sp. RSA 25]
ISLEVQAQCGSKLLKDFMAAATKSDKIAELQKEIEAFATSFPMPGFDATNLKKPQQH